MSLYLCKFQLLSQVINFSTLLTIGPTCSSDELYRRGSDNTKTVLAQTFVVAVNLFFAVLFTTLLL